MRDWKTVRLGDVCEIVNGFAFDSKLFNTDKKGIPLIRIRDVIRGFSETYTTENADSRFLVKVGDLLIGMDGEFNCSLWKSEDSFLNQRVCKIVPNLELINKDYVYYGLKGKLKEIEDKTSFVTVKHISSKQIENIVLKYPPLETQKQIAVQLDKCTALIAKHKQILEKYDILIKSRFIEMFGDNPVKSGKWNVETLGDVCSSIVRGPFGSALKKEFFVPKSDKTIKVYEQKHAIQKSSTIGSYYITQEKYEELKRFECKPGDFLMSCSGTMGEFYQLPDKCEKGIINQALCKFTLNNRIESLFFLEWMKQSIHNLETKGSGIQNVAAVSFIKQMPVFLPPMQLQNNFAAFVHQIDKSKFAVQKSLEKAETLYKSLMQEYFG